MSQHDDCIAHPFPETLHVRLQPDAGDPILIAGKNAKDCLGQADRAAVGVYRLEQLMEVERVVQERPVPTERRRRK